MKYIISESRLDGVIYDYLSSNLEPDYGWHEPRLYKKEAHRWGYVTFDIELRPAFKYFLKPDKPSIEKPKTLLVGALIAWRLGELFGDRWEPVFVKWFDDNTELPVSHLDFVYPSESGSDEI